MPTVLRIGPYRFHFYSNEGSESAHIHVSRDEKEVKFWLEIVSVARNYGFSPTEVRSIEKLVFQNQSFLLEKYNEFHS
jgi:hypothetical protein